MRRTGGEILVDCLIEQGVHTAFGVPGESYLAVLDALYDVQESLRFITTRNEGGASFMAEAYGKLTGTPGICFVTRGPGATNASIGVHTAMQNSSPMILFIGQVARDQKEREAFQEINYKAFYGSIAKWVVEIRDADRIPELISRAFSTALSGRQGPVVIAIPEDMLTDVSSAKSLGRLNIPTASPTQRDMAQVQEALRKAKRPIILVGGSGWTDQGRDDLQSFANRSAIPLTAAFRYQDLFNNTLPNYIGDAGVGMLPHVKTAFEGSDCILAINVRFGEMTTDAWSVFDVPKMKQTLIHVHRSYEEINKIYQCDIAINSCSNEFMSALKNIEITDDYKEWCRENRAKYEKSLFCPKQPSAVDMGEICEYLRQALDNDAIVTNGAGNFAIWPAKFLPFNGKQRFLAPQSGAMGAGLPAALAAKAVDSKRQVICFAGDGDLQMTVQEFGTAAQENLRPIILLLNNQSYGTIRMHQEKHYPKRVVATDIVNPDFVQLANSYGLAAQRVERTKEFIPAFEAIKTTGGLIELIIDTNAISPRATIESLRST